MRAAVGKEALHPFHTVVYVDPGPDDLEWAALPASKPTPEQPIRGQGLCMSCQEEDACAVEDGIAGGRAQHGGAYVEVGGALPGGGHAEAALQLDGEVVVAAATALVRARHDAEEALLTPRLAPGVAHQPAHMLHVSLSITNPSLPLVCRL
jgi:hypothetical protein